jgi:hypothetical protein
LFFLKEKSVAETIAFTVASADQIRRVPKLLVGEEVRVLVEEVTTGERRPFRDLAVGIYVLVRGQGPEYLSVRLETGQTLSIRIVAEDDDHLIEWFTDEKPAWHKKGHQRLLIPEQTIFCAR